MGFYMHFCLRPIKFGTFEDQLYKQYQIVMLCGFLFIII